MSVKIRVEAAVFLFLPIIQIDYSIKKTFCYSEYFRIFVPTTNTDR